MSLIEPYFSIRLSTSVHHSPPTGFVPKWQSEDRPSCVSAPEGRPLSQPSASPPTAGAGMNQEMIGFPRSSGSVCVSRARPWFFEN